MHKGECMRTTLDLEPGLLAQLKEQADQGGRIRCTIVHIFALLMTANIADRIFSDNPARILGRIDEKKPKYGKLTQKATGLTRSLYLVLLLQPEFKLAV